MCAYLCIYSRRLYFDGHCCWYLLDEFKNTEIHPPPSCLPNSSREITAHIFAQIGIVMSLLRLHAIIYIRQALNFQKYTNIGTDTNIWPVEKFQFKFFNDDNDFDLCSEKSKCTKPKHIMHPPKKKNYNFVNFKTITYSVMNVFDIVCLTNFSFWKLQVVRRKKMRTLYGFDKFLRARDARSSFSISR